MDPHFPDLYAIVNLKPTAEVLAVRWAAVAQLAKSQARGRIVSFVRLASAVAGADSAAVVEAARDADRSFQTVNADAEIRVLATATLCELFKTSSKPADAAALAIVARALNGTRGDPLLKHVNGAAKHYLHEEALRVRDGQEASTAITTEKRTAALQEYKTAAEPHGQNPAAVGEPIAKLVEALIAPHGTAISELEQKLGAVREELNMCWWVVTGFSQQLDQPFVDVGIPAACLVAAAELAAMTELLPGPRSATALLDKMLAGVKRDAVGYTIPEAVNATRRTWREKWLQESPPAAVGALAPILTAVQHSLATESGTDWISAFVKSVGLHDLKLAPPVMASQAYTESLLVRAIASLNE